MAEGTKVCLRCSTDRPLDAFAANARNAGGLQRWCRDCTRAWKRENRARIVARNVQYEKENPAKRREWVHRYRSANLERELTKERARSARWRAENPEAHKAQKALRRRRLSEAPGHATTAQVLARVAYYGGRCWMCGAPWEHIDHVKPLSKGGSNWPANLRPACADCNVRKRDRWPLVA